MSSVTHTRGRQSFVGVVTRLGPQGSKSIKVRVTRRKYMPAILKEINFHRDFYTHDEMMACKEGDVVRIEQCRPISKTKHFAVAEIKSAKGQEWLAYQNAAPKLVEEDNRLRTQKFNEDREHGEEVSALSVLEQLREVAEFEWKGPRDQAHEDKVQQIKAHYGIDSWPPNKPIANLSLETLRSEFAKTQSLVEATNMLRNEPARAEELLQQAGFSGKGFSQKRNVLAKALRQ
ncbi:37S ribosomal protein S17 [Yarrowia sp. B02]|nr:37S ribosomal protein S17 [Yarrowia sp. B02]